MPIYKAFFLIQNLFVPILGMGCDFTLKNSVYIFLYKLMAHPKIVFMVGWF